MSYFDFFPVLQAKNRSYAQDASGLSLCACETDNWSSLALLRLSVAEASIERGSPSAALTWRSLASPMFVVDVMM